MRRPDPGEWGSTGVLEAILKTDDRIQRIQGQLAMKVVGQESALGGRGESGPLGVFVHRAGPGSTPQLPMVGQYGCPRPRTRYRACPNSREAFVPAAAVCSLHVRCPRSWELQWDLVAAPQPLPAIQSPQIGQLHPDPRDDYDLEVGRAKSDSGKAGDASLTERHDRRLAPAMTRIRRLSWGRRKNGGGGRARGADCRGALRSVCPRPATPSVPGVSCRRYRRC